MQKNSLNKHILFSVSFSVFAKIFSFAQSILVSWRYGAQRSTDILYFAVTFSLSCASFCNTVNQHVIIPNFIRIRDTKGEEDSMRFANRVFTIYALVAVIGVALMFVFPVPLYSVLSQFAVKDLSENVLILRLTAPMLLLAIANTLITNLFTAYKHFTMPMVVDMIKSALIIVATALPVFSSKVSSLAAAMLIANLLQFAFLLVCMIKILHWRPVFGKITKERTMQRNIIYVIVGQLVSFFAGMLIMRLISGFQEGVYTSMDYAQKVNTVIASVVISQLTTIIGIQIIEYYNNRQLDKLSKVFGNYLTASIYLIAPVCFALSLCAQPVMGLLFERGMFDAQAAKVSAQFFSVFILVIPFNLTGEFFNRLIIAQQIQKVSVIWKIMLNSFNMLFLFIFTRLLGYVGAPLGELGGWIVYTFFLFAVMNHYFPYIKNRKQIFGFWIKCLTLNFVLMLALRWVFADILTATSIAGRIGATAAAGGTFFILYLAFSFLPGMFGKQLKGAFARITSMRKNKVKAPPEPDNGDMETERL